MPVARQLAAVAQVDSVYAERARARLAAMLSPAQYSRLRWIGLEIARALRASATGTEPEDWPHVQTTAANASRSRNEEA